MAPRDLDVQVVTEWRRACQNRDRKTTTTFPLFAPLKHFALEVASFCGLISMLVQLWKHAKRFS